MYGRSAASIGEQIGADYKEAQKIIDDFYNSFPKVRYWTDKSVEDAKVTGYVETLWGRKRRLPDILLPKYSITSGKSNGVVSEVNPLLFTKGLVQKQQDPNIEKYKNQLNNARGWQQVKKIKESAIKDGITIKDNGMFISRAERQCVNARIQGSAADMSKLAMVKVFHDKQLRELGFKIVLQIHDELIGECPEENAQQVADRLTEVMKHSAEPKVSVPFKCDPSIVPCWYFDDFGDELCEQATQMIEQGKLKQDVLNYLKSEHTELTEEQFNELLKPVLQDK